jgi:hypothetical protein
METLEMSSAAHSFSISVCSSVLKALRESVRSPELKTKTTTESSGDRETLGNAPRKHEY